MSHGIYLLQPDTSHLSQLSSVVMPAMANRVGGVMQGANVTIAADGTISTAAPTAPYVLPLASANSLGGVKIGANITVTGDGTISVAAPGTGTVTSVGLSMPAEFSVAGSPVTANGTLAVTKTTQLANLVYAGPASGGAAVPTFRALTAADLSAVAVGLQTPWLSNINAAGFSLSNVGAITASSTITATGLITGSVATPANGYLRVVASPLYGDTNDGRITVGLGAPGLNIVGINTDNTNRKISFWGTLTQIDAAGAAFGGTTTVSNLTASGTATVGTLSTANITSSTAIINFSVDLRALNQHHFEAYSSDNSKVAYFYTDTAGNMQFISTSGVQVMQALTTSNNISVGGQGIKYTAIGTTPHIHGFNWTGTLAAYVDGSSVGTITITSERFMKEDIQPYHRGLDAIRQLNPVSFKYIPQPWRGLGQTHYGLVADEVEPHIPEMVTRETTNVEGEQKELRYLDPRPMWYMLVNAVKELDQRLKALEQAIKVVN